MIASSDKPVTKSSRHWLVVGWRMMAGASGWHVQATIWGGGWLCRAVESSSSQLHDHLVGSKIWIEGIQICNCRLSHLNRALVALKQRKRVWGKGSFSYALGECIVLWFKKQFCLVRVINTSWEKIPVTSCVPVVCLFLYSTMFF